VPAVPRLAGVIGWSVPAMGGVQRLPDAIPADGEQGGTVRIVAAHGEYEPGSFVVRSDTDLGKVQPVVEKLVNENGNVFPANALDLVVVKVWYQNKNGWFSYFADTGMKLCPELLLHDEDLIRVDTAKEANYARITSANGKIAEWWLNPLFKEKKQFPSMRLGFADAKSIRPVALEKNVSKQFILTAHVTPGIPAGIYRGNIVFSSSTPPLTHSSTFSIPVAIKVLDFDLPKPMAYIHPEMDFRICSYDYIGKNHILELNGGDENLMWKDFAPLFEYRYAMSNQLVHKTDTGCGQILERCRRNPLYRSISDLAHSSTLLVSACFSTYVRIATLLKRANADVKVLGPVFLKYENFFNGAQEIEDAFVLEYQKDQEQNKATK
jgi:hypothetical protein